MSDFSKPIRVEESKDYFNVLYGGVSLVKVSKSTLKVFLADLGPNMSVSVEKKKVIRKKRKTRISMIAEEHEMNAKQLIIAYTKQKRKFFHSKAVNSISVNSPEFKHFVASIKIIKRHKVTYKKYLEAQVAGLSFVGDGKGIFPKPSQLSSDAAETRLLQYLREYSGTGDKIPVVKISADERNTGLLYNSKYLRADDNVRAKTATLVETVYVREMQMVRKGKVKKYVNRYLERFT